jgi:CarD family transcriptional regulator
VNKHLSFRIGDRVVYPSRGVAEIGEIVDKEIAGTVERFYVLRLLDGGSTILVPVARSAELGLRDVIDRKEVAKILRVLRMQGERRDHEPWNRRQRGFLEKIRSGDILEVAEVVRDLWQLGQSKPLSFGERRLLETTRKLLVQELSVAWDRPGDHVERELDRVLSHKADVGH